MLFLHGNSMTGLNDRILRPQRLITFMMSETTKKMRKIKNRTCAMDADVPAMPPKPKAPAINATTRNTSA